MAKSERSITLSQLPTNKPNQYIEVIATYNEGGSYNGQTWDRGYYIMVGSVGIERSPSGGTIRTLGLFSAPTVLLERADRFNAKRLAKIGETIPRRHLTRRLINEVLAKEGLTLIGPLPPLRWFFPTLGPDIVMVCDGAVSDPKTGEIIKGLTLDDLIKSDEWFEYATGDEDPRKVPMDKGGLGKF